MDHREVLKWHHDERASLVRQLDHLTGQLRSREQADGRMTDTSEATIADLRRRLAKLDAWLSEA